MGLFFNYDKPGKGVDKNAPKKRGIFLFLELLWRNFGKLLKTNLIYTLISIPAMLVYYLVLISLLPMYLPETEIAPEVINHIVIIISMIFTILWGSGPISCGYTYVLRSFARDEHTWVVSDLFEKSRENFKSGLVIWLVDIVVLILSAIAVAVYWQMAQGGNTLFLFLMMVVIIMLALYTAMHFYLYELAVTFEGGILQRYKNAALLAFGTLPMCIFIIALISFLTLWVFSYLSAIGIVLLSVVCWVTFMRFIADFYSARLIKRKLIKEESDS